MKTAKLFRRWRNRVAKCLDRADQARRQAATTGPAEAVHELRVQLRRLRLMVRLGKPLLPKDAAARFRRWSRGVSDAVGRVRDYDVILEWLARQPDSEMMVRTLQSHRDALWRSARRRLIALPPAVKGALTKAKAGAADQSAFAKRHGKIHRKYRRRVEAMAPRFFDLPLDEQHEFRRQLRQFRFLHELQLPGRKQGRDPVLRRLIALQQALGASQDCLIGQEILAQYGESVGVEIFRQALAREQNLWLTRIRPRLKALKKPKRP
jgi:CHAD domain-containing protein